MESKPNFAKVHGPWWTQIKVVLIQKGLLDNQNPGFCMGWPGLYLMDSIEHSRSVCNPRFDIYKSSDKIFVWVAPIFFSQLLACVAQTNIWSFLFCESFKYFFKLLTDFDLLFYLVPLDTSISGMWVRKFEWTKVQMILDHPNCLGRVQII